jgi:hypothetical protein
MEPLFDTRLTPAVAEAKLLHPGAAGYFTVCRRERDGSWREKHMAMSTLEQTAMSLRSQHDCYISQASFATKLRRSSNTRALSSSFLDLDTYNVGGMGKDEAVEKILQRAEQSGLPAPSYIASSGRGYYAKWLYSNSITDSLLPQWKLMQKRINSAFIDMGSDAKVCDPARVLRLQETINSKSGTAVKLLQQSEHYNFQELFLQTSELPILKKRKDGTIIKLSDAVVHQGVRRTSRDLSTDAALTDLQGLGLYSESRTPVMLSRRSTQSLAWCRFLDLRDLVISRGGIHQGSRDITLFWMVNFLAQANVIEPGNFWDEVTDLVKSFPTSSDFQPLSDGSLGSVLERVQMHARGETVTLDGKAYSPIYTPRNDTLINIFGITSDEEQNLRTIISGDEKLRRADAKVPGRQERRQCRNEERAVAVSLAAQGKTTQEIAQELGKDRTTVWRWLKPDVREGRPYIENRGRSRNPHKGQRYRITGRGVIDQDGVIHPFGKPIPSKRLPAQDANPPAPLSHPPEIPPIDQPQQRAEVIHVPGAADQPAKAPIRNTLNALESLQDLAGPTAKRRALTMEELRDRMRVRRAPPHRASNFVPWTAQRVIEWLELRRARQAERAAQQQATDKLIGEVLDRQRERERQADCAQRLSQEILHRIRQAARQRAGQSLHETGPPTNSTGLDKSRDN